MFIELGRVQFTPPFFLQKKIQLSHKKEEDFVKKTENKKLDTNIGIKVLSIH